METNALFVFRTHEEVWQHNKSKLQEMNACHPVLRISATFQGPHSKQADPDKSGGLLNTLFLCQGAKVMLTINISVPFGLFNGALGHVVDIIYKEGRKPEDGLPDVVMVDFPNYSGPPFIQNNTTLIPILPITRQVECFCHKCKKIQIPLRLGWATTVHKCQGMTIGEGEINNHIVINPGTRSFESRNPGALFVALSRAKSTGLTNNTLPDFAWHPSILVNEDRLCHIVRTKTTESRSTEILRLQNLAKITKNQYQHLYDDHNYIRHAFPFLHLILAPES